MGRSTQLYDEAATLHGFTRDPESDDSAPRYTADGAEVLGVPGLVISEWWTQLAWRITSPSRKGRKGADTFDSIDLAMREANKRKTR